MDGGKSHGRGAWWAAIYGVAQSRTRLRDLAATAAALRLQVELTEIPGDLLTRLSYCVLEMSPFLHILQCTSHVIQTSVSGEKNHNALLVVSGDSYILLIDRKSVV